MITCKLPKLSYTGSTGHSLNTHSYTPSRPSSQETYTTYEGHSVTGMYID